MTTTRRLIAAALLSAALTTTGAAGASAASSLPPAGPDDGVRVSVEIREREVPATPRVVVVGEGPFVAGGTVVVRGSGLAPHTEHEVWLLSEPVLLATVTTDADGAFEVTVTLPATTPPGEHTIRVVAPSSGAEVVSEPFEVVAPTGPTEPTEPTEPTGPTSPGDGGPGTVDPGTGPGTSASPPPGGLATTGAGLAAVAVLAALAVAAGVVLRRRRPGSAA